MYGTRPPWARLSTETDIPSAQSPESPGRGPRSPRKVQLMSNRHLFAFAIVAAILAGGCTSSQAQEQKSPEARKARSGIVGHTVFAGKPPRRARIDTSAYPVCATANDGQPIYSERVVVDPQGRLANVVVWIKNVPKGQYQAKRNRVILDQVGCRYVPHALAVQIGQELLIRNSDNRAACVHFKSRLNGDWNIGGLVKKTVPPVQKFTKPEIGTAVFKCDLLPWMECRVAIFDHPFFAVSAKDGTFEIPTQGLPAGRYEIWAWHEKYKSIKLKDVDLHPDEQTPLTITFNKKRGK